MPAHCLAAFLADGDRVAVHCVLVSVPGIPEPQVPTMTHPALVALQQSADERRAAHFDTLPPDIREFLMLRAKVDWGADRWADFTTKEKQSVMAEVQKFERVGRYLKELVLLS